MKKSLGLILALAVVLALFAPVFADNLKDFASTKTEVIHELTEEITDPQEKADFVKNRQDAIAIAKEVKLQEELDKKRTTDQIQQKEQKLTDLLSLNDDELKAVRNNKGLSDEKHDKLQNIIYKALDDLVILPDKEQITKIIEALFFTRDVNFRDNKNYDFSVFFVKEERTPGLQYFNSWTDFYKRAEKDRMQQSNYNGASDIYSINASIEDIMIKQDQAVVMAHVEESILYSDGSTGYCWKDYSISLVQDNGRWLISDITSNDAQEVYHLENGFVFDVEKRLELLREEAKLISDENGEVAASQNTTSEADIASASGVLMTTSRAHGSKIRGPCCTTCLKGR